MQKIAQNVYVETGFEGANCGFVVTEEGVVMIESPQIPKSSLQWREEIAKHGRVRYLINTEPHDDHFAGNYYFEGTVVGHEGTREAILKARMDRFPRGIVPPEKDFHFRPSTITLSQRMTLYVGKHTFKLINMPGHTPYQVAVYIPEEKVVFTSDNVVGHMAYMDQSSPQDWLASLKQLEQLDAEYYVPGHGDVRDKSCLQEMTGVVQGWIDTVKQTIEKGMSCEEAQDAIPQMPGYKSDRPDRHMVEVQRRNIAHLYRLLK